MNKLKLNFKKQYMTSFNLEKMERRYITEALIRSNNRCDEASKLLGISIRTLSRKKAQHNINSEIIKELIKQRNKN